MQIFGLPDEGQKSVLSYGKNAFYITKQKAGISSGHP